MKIIDNRYKIERMIEDRKGYFELYKIINLWEDDKVQYLKLYNTETQKKLINYFIDDFNNLSNIKHENLLSINNFNLVKTIDTKRTNMLLYYSISEYIDAPKLDDIIEKLNLEERVRLILDIMLTIEFLHFRGFTYKYLNPKNIYVLENNEVKLNDLAAIVEARMNNNDDEILRNFISPESLLNKEEYDSKIDYYSIGVLMKYLLLKDYMVGNIELFSYEDNLNLTEDQKYGLNDIINQLTKRDRNSRGTSLIELIDRINLLFELGYDYDLVENREVLFFENKAVGREKQMNKVDLLDKSIVNGTSKYRAVMIDAGLGIGKTNFIDEISRKLVLKGRDVYSIKVMKTDGNDLLDMSNILKQSIRDTSTELMDKYRNELSKILPELRLDINENMGTDFSERIENFRIYNRILNYFTDLSKERIIYIMIDDIHNSNVNFITLLNYLVGNIKSENICFVFSYDKNSINNNSVIKENISRWEKNRIVKKIELYNLGIEEIGGMLQNILGIEYKPIDFATVLFKESQGNPSYIEQLLKGLFSSKDLFINKWGKWELNGESYEDIYFPHNIGEAVRKQFDTIKGKYFEIFKTMSIFGNIVYKNILFKMIDSSQDKVSKYIDELIKLKFIDEKVTDWGYSYAINNIELKKLVYHEIPEKEKVYLHSKAANIILNYDYEHVQLEMEELLFHLIKSNQSDRAVSIIIKNAQSLDNKYSTQSLFLWERAYNIVKHSTTKTKLLVLNNLVDIYFLKGETEKGNLYLKEYQKEAEYLKSYDHIIRGKSILLDSYYRKSEMDLAWEEIKDMEEISKKNHILEGIILSLAIRARFKIRNQELDESMEILEESLRLSESLGITTYLGDIYNRIGLINFLKGRTEKAIENYKKSIAIYEKNNNYMEATRPINNIAVIYAERGNNAKAMENYKKGLDITNKYGFQEVNTIFLNNISEIHIANYEFDKALECVQEAKKSAIELQDVSTMFLGNINLGFIYLYTGNYDSAYECFKYLKGTYESEQVLDIGMTIQYNKFMGTFYGYLGKWQESIKYSNVVKELCHELNTKEYLEASSLLVFCKFRGENYLDKEEINRIREEYKKTEMIQFRRKYILHFAMMGLLNGDREYALELLDEDLGLIELFNNNYLEGLRRFILLNINTTEESINKMIYIKEQLRPERIDEVRFFYNMKIGLQFFTMKKFEQSLQYLFDALDNVYRAALRIPDKDLKISYIESRNADLIKCKITEAIEYVFGKKPPYTPLRNIDIDIDNLYDYFDISDLIHSLSNEEFVKITQLSYGDDVLSIQSIGDLVSGLTEDFGNNLDLILGYIGKVSLANKGYILTYDEKTRKYVVLSSLGSNLDYLIDENILALANRNNKGILINDNVANRNIVCSREYLPNEIKAIICVPIVTYEDGMRGKDDRRKGDISNNSRVQGYVYLETDKIFNKFDQDTFNLVSNLLYLIFINIVNNDLKLMATTDNLTGLFTRRYYETMFDQLITSKKEVGGKFSVLMLDIDFFKDINDNYGHRKGDEVLSLIGSAIKSTVRNTDISGRYGGEEFSILLKNITEDKAHKVAEKIRRNIESLKIAGMDYPITISIGISSFPKHSQFKEELIVKADQALYHAKQSGRNQTVIWNNKMVNTSNRADKLAGILTGNANEDNRNILAMLDIIELIKENLSIKDKIFMFLGRILETIDAEYASIILIQGKDPKEYFTRSRFKDEWLETPFLNLEVIHRVIESAKGEFLIDWDNIENIDPLFGLPNWQSIIVLPMIRDECIRGILYISVPIESKEFTFNNFNLSKSFGNIFGAII